MSVYFIALATLSAGAALALGLPILKARYRTGHAGGSARPVPAGFTPTHTYRDARSGTLLACDMKSATVCVVDADKQLDQDILQPIQLIENVSLTINGKTRATEIRLDIALADERRSLVQIHFLDRVAGRSSDRFLQAQELANKWLARLGANIEDPAAFRAALGPDSTLAQGLSTSPAWQLPATGALAALSALSIALAVLPAPAAPPDMAAARPAAATVRPVAAGPAAPARPIAVTDELPEQVDIPLLVRSLQARIDDVSESSLMQASRIDTAMLMGQLDELDQLARDIEQASNPATERSGLGKLSDVQAHLVSVQQDVLPRYRRLYGSVVQGDAGLPVAATTGGYASRELWLTHPSLDDDATRTAVTVSLRADLTRFRFDKVVFRTTPHGIPVESVEFDTQSDAILTTTATDTRPAAAPGQG